MNMCSIEISLKRLQFSLQIQDAPEWDLIEKLSSDCPNESFNERMRERYIGNCLDLHDPKMYEQDDEIAYHRAIVINVSRMTSLGIPSKICDE